MSYAQLAEGASNLVVDYIKANIASALDVVAANATQPKVAIENPRSYLTFEQPQAYECPAVFIIFDSQDFQVAERKANSINALDMINVAVCVEDIDEDLLNYKAWRYQSALFSILNLSTIAAQDGSLVLKSVVYNSRFSPVYSRPEGNGPGGKFRKEVMLECRMTHLENF